MSRIAPRRSGLQFRIADWSSRIVYGRRLASVGVYANHPRQMWTYVRYNRFAERTKRVPEHLAELAVLEAATIVGCEFCIDIGSEFARRSGLSDEQLLALHRAHESGLFSDDELLVIDLAAGMTRTPGKVGDELMARVVERFGSKGALELTHLIAWENLRARWNVALEVRPEGFSEGKVCALPRTAELAAAPTDRGSSQLSTA